MFNDELFIDHYSLIIKKGFAFSKKIFIFVPCYQSYIITHHGTKKTHSFGFSFCI